MPRSPKIRIRLHDLSSDYPIDFEILGKLEPDNTDQKWFGDITKSVEINRRKCDGYTRVELKLPMETDFLQPHVLLIPDNAQPGQCPAVIAWTSTGPDYAEPENWWGAWLARRGCVVLTGWSFIRIRICATHLRSQGDGA